MLSINRITAIYLRHFYQFAEASRLISAFYWPLMDILIWGYSAQWIQGTFATNSHLALTTISCVVFWQVAVRANMEVSGQLSEEIWARNVTNLFATPLTLDEWICAILGFGLTMAFVMALFGMACAWYVYNINLFVLWHVSVPAILLMYISGIWCGLLMGGFIVRFGGERMQTIAFIISWAMAPLAGVYYDISILPAWGQTLASILPMRYVFEGVREYLTLHQFPYHSFSIAFILAILYSIIMLLFFMFMFYASKQRGLTRLDE